MSQIDDLASRYPRNADATAKAIGKRSLDWAMLVVAIAFGATLAWIYLIFHALAYALQVLLS